MIKRMLNSKFVNVFIQCFVIILIASYVMPMLPFKNVTIAWLLLIMACIGYFLNEWAKRMFNSIFDIFQAPIRKYLSDNEIKILDGIKRISYTFFTLTMGLSISTIFIKMDFALLNQDSLKLNDLFFNMTITVIFIYVFLNLYYLIKYTFKKGIGYLRMFHLPANSSNRTEFENARRELLYLLGDRS